MFVKMFESSLLSTICLSAILMASQVASAPAQSSNPTPTQMLDNFLQSLIKSDVKKDQNLLKSNQNQLQSNSYYNHNSRPVDVPKVTHSSAPTSFETPVSWPYPSAPQTSGGSEFPLLDRFLQNSQNNNYMNNNNNNNQNNQIFSKTPSVWDAKPIASNWESNQNTAPTWESKPNTPLTWEQNQNTPLTWDPKPNTPSPWDSKPNTPSPWDSKPNTPSTWDSKPNTPSTWDSKPNTPSTWDSKPNIPLTWDAKPSARPAWETKPNTASNWAANPKLPPVWEQTPAPWTPITTPAPRTDNFPQPLSPNEGFVTNIRPDSKPRYYSLDTIRMADKPNSNSDNLNVSFILPPQVRPLSLNFDSGEVLVDFGDKNEKSDSVNGNNERLNQGLNDKLNERSNVRSKLDLDAIFSSYKKQNNKESTEEKDDDYIIVRHDTNKYAYDMPGSNAQSSKVERIPYNPKQVFTLGRVSSSNA